MTRLQRDRDTAVSEDGHSQSNGASALPAEEQGWRTEQAAAGGNLVEGDPSVSSRTPQASVQTAQNIAQGDNATPLETGLRQQQRGQSAGGRCQGGP